MKLLLRAVVLVGLCIPIAARCGSFQFGITRYFPTAYSDPKIERRAAGRSTYKPSIPTDFEQRDLGAGGKTSRIRVSGSEQTVVERPGVTIRLRDTGHRVKIYQGEVFKVRGRKYRLINVWDDKIEFQSLKTGQILTKKRPRKTKH